MIEASVSLSLLGFSLTQHSTNSFSLHSPSCDSSLSHLILDAILLPASFSLHNQGSHGFISTRHWIVPLPPSVRPSKDYNFLSISNWNCRAKMWRVIREVLVSQRFWFVWVLEIFYLFNLLLFVVVCFNSLCWQNNDSLTLIGLKLDVNNNCLQTYC